MTARRSINAHGGRTGLIACTRAACYRANVCRKGLMCPGCGGFLQSAFELFLPNARLMASSAVIPMRVWPGLSRPGLSLLRAAISKDGRQQKKTIVIDVAERLEPMLGLPILGINPVTFWYALRENGFEGPLQGGGQLLHEF